MEQSSGKTDIKIGIKDKVKNIYESQYKKLLIIPFALLFISFILIGVHYAQYGEFVKKDVSLKGGITLTIPTDKEIDIDALEHSLAGQFPKNDIGSKSVSQLGKQVAIIVDSDISEGQVDSLIDAIGSALGKQLSKEDYALEVVGPSLGKSFFKELMIALLIAFVFMAIVVFAQFRTIVPSVAVILAAFSDMIVTLAIINLLGVKISAAGIAAFLMLIGYSVDTDILLSNRVLKRRDGTEMEKIYGSIDTGMKMTMTAIAALVAGLLISQSEVIRQIMTILLIGLLVDMINTWIQNVGILRLYLEKKRQ